jgi:hypothetical protein
MDIRDILLQITIAIVFITPLVLIVIIMVGNKRNNNPKRR